MRYDTTLKEIFNALPQTLLKLLVGQEGVELLTIEFPAVKKRLPDLVVRLANGSLFHLELQSDPEMMSWRMLEYYVLIRGLHPVVPLKQMVLYVGPVKSRPLPIIEETDLTFRYTVRDIQDIDCRHMLDSSLLEENLLAILCRMVDERNTIRQVLTRIGTLPAKAGADALEKLMVLAGLRKLETVIIQEIDEMAISVDVMENAFLRDIFGKGEENGRQKEAVHVFRRLLKKKFPTSFQTDRVERKLAGASLEDIEKWTDRILDVGTFDDVFEN